MGKALAKPRQWTIARCDGKVWKPIYTEQQAALVAFPIRLKVRLDVKFSFPNGSDEEAEQDMEREDSGTEWDE